MDQKGFETLKALKNSVPENWELVAKNLKALKLSAISQPFTDEQAEHFSAMAKLMANSVDSLPLKEVLESLSTYREQLEDVSKIYKSLAISQKLSEKKAKKVEEVAQEIVDEYSEDLNPVVQMTEEGLVVASEINWNVIENLEPNEEIPTKEADKIRKTFLFSVAFKKLKGLTPDKITKSDVYQWFAILYMILSFLYLVLNLADKLS